MAAAQPAWSVEDRPEPETALAGVEQLSPQALKLQRASERRRKREERLRKKNTYQISAFPEERMCIEMYSRCNAESPKRCESAPIWLQCGEVAKHPLKDKWIECVCDK